MRNNSHLLIKHAAAADILEVAQFNSPHTERRDLHFNFLDYCNYIDLQEFCGVHVFSRGDNDEIVY